MDRNVKAAEGVQRLRILHIHPNAIRDFESDGIVNVSENGGFLYWASDKEKNYISEFEKTHNAVVYHVIRSRVMGCEHLSFLYVSDYREEWEDDRRMLSSGYPLVYVKNVDDDILSEFGSIEIRENIGGLIRTA